MADIKNPFAPSFVDTIRSELFKIGSSFPQGFGFGLGYGAGVRVGFENLYPAIKDAGAVDGWITALMGWSVGVEQGQRAGGNVPLPLPQGTPAGIPSFITPAGLPAIKNILDGMGIDTGQIVFTYKGRNLTWGEMAILQSGTGTEYVKLADSLQIRQSGFSVNTATAVPQPENVTPSPPPPPPPNTVQITANVTPVLEKASDTRTVLNAYGTGIGTGLSVYMLEYNAHITSIDGSLLAIEQNQSFITPGNVNRAYYIGQRTILVNSYNTRVKSYNQFINMNPYYRDLKSHRTLSLL